MKFLKKPIVVLVVAVILLAALPISASAESKSVIQFSSNQVNVGQDVTVTIKFSSDHNIVTSEAKISYDASLLKFKSSTDVYNGGSGVLTMARIGNSQSFTFSVIKAGNCKFTVYDAAVSDGDSEYPAAGASATLKIIDKSANVSANANLKSMSVSSGTLTPAFSPSVTTYSVTIGADVSKLILYAETEDKSAKLAVSGASEMKTGANRRSITVTAANGITKTYTVNITKLAAGETDTSSQQGTSSGTENPQTGSEEIVIDGNVYNIKTDLTGLFVPDGMTADTAVYNSKNYPVIKNKSSSVTAFYLWCDATQKGAFYTYDFENGKFTPLSYVTAGGNTYIILPLEDGTNIPDGFKESKRTISGNETVVYETPENYEFCLIYTEGTSGNRGFYVYDTVENTVQRYFGFSASGSKDVGNKPKANILTELLDNPFYRMIIIASAAAIVIVLVILIIVLAVKSSRAKRRDELDDYDDENLLDFSISGDD